MDKSAELINEPSYFFTEPWEPVIVRRGDALGLGALADNFADAVAPDFSNRIRDGRWVTILAWCLVQSHKVFHASGGRAAETRAQQSKRYAWLRPLELMWVARTIALLEKDEWKKRSLAGQRRVEPWYDDGKKADRFGMSPDQFRAYRQIGMYGGYRLAFRKWPGMTVHGDGWTPGPASMELADWLDKKLSSARLHLGDEIKTRSQGKEDGWWLKSWEAFDQLGRSAIEDTLPRSRDDFTVLPEAEFLQPLIFGDYPQGQKRLRVARSIQKATATNHLELCRHLSDEFRADPVIARLYDFSRLADAGIAAMVHVADVLGGKPYVALKEVAQHKGAAAICKELMASAQAWRKGAQIQPRHIEAAHRFANAITATNGQPIECLRTLLHHHETYGGGLRWFVLRNGRIEPRTLPRGMVSRYGFRLWPLCRLAAQCGVIRTMPTALRNDPAYLEEDENDGDKNGE
jgi:hypothetical protein